MNSVNIIIAENSNNPVTITTEQDPNWTPLQQDVTIDLTGATISGTYEVRQVEDKPNNKTYWLMPMP